MLRPEPFRFSHLEPLADLDSYQPPLEKPSPGQAFFLEEELVDVAMCAKLGQEVPGSRVMVAKLDREELALVSRTTLSHYERSAESFREGTRDHDVSHNVAALLRHIEGKPPFSILDVGCGPGRDLDTFQALGHVPVGLDGAPSFVRMARESTGAEVLEQDLLQLELPREHFDGVFANAVLFHVPLQELPRVLSELYAALRPRGVLFSSNPRGPDCEEWRGERYGSFLTWETWRALVIAAGFAELEHYYRPTGVERARQPWLASVWRRIDSG